MGQGISGFRSRFDAMLVVRVKCSEYLKRDCGYVMSQFLMSVCGFEENSKISRMLFTVVELSPICETSALELNGWSSGR